MAYKLPPTPVGVPPGHSFWNDWYEKIRYIINDAQVEVVWSNINFTGSNLTSIATRNHNDLQSFQGGTTNQYYHLDSVDYTALSGTRITKGTDTTDDIIIDLATKGLVLKDTQGTPHYWRVTINTVGALVTTDLGTTKP